MVLDARRLVLVYVWLLGLGLLVEGGLLLLFEALGAARWSLPITTGDTRHNALHAVWGLAILIALVAGPAKQRAPLIAVVFGVFYTALAVLGVLIDRPFGLLLGPGENVFHWIVGPLALGLGLWNLGSAQKARAPSAG